MSIAGHLLCLNIRAGRRLPTWSATHGPPAYSGDDGWNGGIARWLRLATGLGLDRDFVASQRGGLPATRFVVGAYLSFCTDKSLLEAVACSVTELFSPVIISERVPAMLARYDYIREDILEYFKPTPVQASRDADYALAYVRQKADTA